MGADSQAISILLRSSRQVFSSFASLPPFDSEGTELHSEAWLKLRHAIDYLQRRK